MLTILVLLTLITLGVIFLWIGDLLPGSILFLLSALLFLGLIILGYTSEWFAWVGVKAYKKISKTTEIESSPRQITRTEEDQPGKTLWDWLQFLVALAIPIAIAVGTTWFSYQQAQSSQQIADEQRQEALLQTYLDRMSDLILNPRVHDQQGEGVRILARARTLTVLQSLDGPRKATVLRFLSYGGLIKRLDPASGNIDPIVNLSGADFSKVDLRGTNGILLGGADLAEVILTGAHLEGAHLEGSYLNGANLSYSSLNGVDLSYAHLNGTDLVGADFGPDLGNGLNGANLFMADLSGADLVGANFSQGQGKVLSGANLSKAVLTGACRTGANLQGARVTREQFMKAKGQCWHLTRTANLLEIAYGGDASSPQYGALDLKSSYLRLNYGPASGWGTSIILLPAFWSKVPVICIPSEQPSRYCQGAPITSTYKINDVGLVLSITGTMRVSMLPCS